MNHHAVTAAIVDHLTMLPRRDCPLSSATPSSGSSEDSYSVAQPKLAGTDSVIEAMFSGNFRFMLHNLPVSTMHIFGLVLNVIALALTVYAQETETLGGVQQAFFNPSVFMDVEFAPSESSDERIVDGRVEVALQPNFGLTKTDSSTVSTEHGFVVMMMDLDAPFPDFSVVSPYRHFLGGDFFPASTSYCDCIALVNSTAPVSNWVSPDPQGKNPHRYVFLLYVQSARFNNQTIVTPATPINNFDVSSFAQAVGLGNPIGGTYMLVQRD
ncbi:phosphatidylethanolamine-binding protein [Amylocystis lapponica]|nr:phosphatidylethanolamine-binding protein [Amylocystis lapponica]